jgi:ubiquinol-cytochrome c reductase cytochrome c1 subunit
MAKVRLIALAAFGFAALVTLPALAQDSTTETPAAPAAETPAAPATEVAPAAETPAAPATEAAPATTEAPAAAPAAEAPAAAPAGEHAAAAEGHEGEAPHYPIKKPVRQDWSFGGIFGKYDPAQLQRGFQVYKEVCSSCHSLNLVAFRTLADKRGPYYSEEQVKALAAEYQITDGPDEAGDMFQRPGRPSDHFPAPFANAQAAAAANGGAAPPDLSLMAKARGIGRGFPWFLLDGVTTYQEGGPDYIHALLTGYEEPPAGTKVPEGTHYNPFFANGPALAMPKPLSDGQVTYGDGSPQTVDQYAKDVAAFLMWTAEPRMTDRKELGFRVMIFLIVFAVLMYLTKRRVWAREPH